MPVQILRFIVPLMEMESLFLKDECPVNALRAQNLAGGHFVGHEIRLVFVSLSI